jgi:tRNA(Ile)-lysidine synthase
MIANSIQNFFTKQFVNFPKNLAVAVSGGVDSLALAILLNEFCQKNNIKLFAITIDHKMRESSSIEALELHKILKQKKISHQILTINWDNIPQKNIEAKLREARYELLYNFCKKNKIEHLFLGHHLNDAAENFLIRLFRGSGIDGLSVMQEISEANKIKLCRPLLNNTKDELKTFLATKKIKYFEDESNQDEKFLRNKIRKILSRFDEKNLIQKRIKKAAEEIFESKKIIDEIVVEKATEALEIKDGYFILDVEKFQKIPKNIALKILASVLIELSGKTYKPRLLKLNNLYEWILNPNNQKKRSLYGCEIEPYKQAVDLNKTLSSRAKFYDLSQNKYFTIRREEMVDRF